MRIRRIDIENFRGIKSASWRLPADRRFFALIGPGDATKTTVLTAIERALHDRAGLSVLDTDFFGATVDEPSGSGSRSMTSPTSSSPWTPSAGSCPASTRTASGPTTRPTSPSAASSSSSSSRPTWSPIWQSYRPPLEGVDDEEPHPIRARHRARMTAYRIDDRVDAHLRWSRTSSLGKLTASRDDTRATLTYAGREARDAAAEAVTDALKDARDRRYRRRCRPSARPSFATCGPAWTCR